MSQRRTDLDALRSFAMLLGIALHASLSFLNFPWPIHDTQRSSLLLLVLATVHSFRMPLFFLLSGYFSMLVYRRSGLTKLLEQRFKRIFVPLLIALATIVPLNVMLENFAIGTIQPAPEIAEILSGNEVAVRARLAISSANVHKDSFWGRTPLAWATLHGDPAIVSTVLDAGADIHERDNNGNTLLHFAAVFGRDAAGRVLIERGADPLAKNVLGMLPSAGLKLSAEQMSEFAPRLGITPVTVDEILQGRSRLKELLPSEPNSEGLLDRLATLCAQVQSSGYLRIHFGSWSFHLVETNIFYHLWFLWFLCWLVVIFAILVRFGLTPTSRSRWWLVVVSCVPQALMGASLAGGFGPDTSLGLIPKFPVIFYYACFFFFGCATFESNGLQKPTSLSWRFMLPLACVLLVTGLATTNNRILATFLQPAIAWTMSLGFIGLFAHLSSKFTFLGQSPAISWLADASYFMYLVHVPLVLVAQWIVRQWLLPAELKFLIVLSLVIPLLLISYRWCVRYTSIGRLLNGPRAISKLGQ